MDVYAFGMFMYYLISFMHPFENESRPITALIEEGRRPELPPKVHSVLTHPHYSHTHTPSQLRPHSLYMFELMCWCWSDLPQHRPKFDQILTVLRTDTFTTLLAATSITQDNDEVTAATVITTRARRSSVTSFHGRSSASYFASDLSYTNALSLVVGGAGHGEELTTQVWYGTERGSCGVVQFQRGGVVKEV